MRSFFMFCMFRAVIGGEVQCRLGFRRYGAMPFGFSEKGPKDHCFISA